MHIDQPQFLAGPKMLAQRMELARGDLVLFEASFGGVESAHVFDEGTSGGRR